MNSQYLKKLLLLSLLLTCFGMNVYADEILINFNTSSRIVENNWNNFSGALSSEAALINQAGDDSGAKIAAYSYFSQLLCIYLRQLVSRLAGIYSHRRSYS